MCRSAVNRLPETSPAKIFGISRESKFWELAILASHLQVPSLAREGDHFSREEKEMGEGYRKQRPWLFIGWGPTSFFLPLGSNIIAGIDTALFNWNFFLLIFLTNACYLLKVLQMLQQKLTLVRWIVVETHYDSHTSKCSTCINYLNTRTLISLQVFTWGNWSTKRWKKKVLVTQSCLTLCNPRECSLPGFTGHGILQARILE